MNKDKKYLIDKAFSNAAIKTCADLGGIYDVNGVYMLYALEQYHLKSAIIVDTYWTEEAKKNCKDITCIEDNFGNSNIPKKVGIVDIIFLFDVLLHQVDPDWRRILQMYAPYTQYFLIHNPQYTNSPISIRLLDLGKEEYLKNVPHDSTNTTYENLFLHMYEINSEHKRIWRDIHSVWQWGITDKDLIFTLDRLGFSLDYICNHGTYENLKMFENHSFIFNKR